MTAGNKKFLKVFYLLCITMMALLWLQQRSINAYWIQTYHQGSPLSVLDKYSAWQVGGDITAFLSTQLESVQADITALNDETIAVVNNHLINMQDDIPLVDNQSAEELALLIDSQAVFKSSSLLIFPQKPFLQVVEIKAMDKEQVITNSGLLIVSPAFKDRSEPELIVNKDNRFLLEKGQKVFFVGDSLMQGVAPHAMRSLLKVHGIESINLSKQSTGLSYPRFYNWPQMARETFSKNPDIKLMVVFMGPNDPWDFPVVRGKRFLKFNTPEWEGVYRARIQQLINAATDHGAQVLWIGVPNMKDTKLNVGVIKLNKIYQSQVTIAGQRYIPSNDLLGMQDDQFVKFLRIPNRGNVTLRTDDGVHFTIIGQKRIADKIISLLRFNDSMDVNK
ncbi:SGNH/GDSL hydrolase family protein [Entomomonas asaccharolytica]|uniref:DUF459 domain-containing protein n=1 Tax=Entomomonas asaccharolytica TaxID=2785331 RepID=A0A974NG07_9GAMM|nr:SGNH family hydrolase [Entomomonas asaccharolytica]QQP85889.1 DUF459 domain-containing protein [Entomomonas asaccharolytica]